MVFGRGRGILCIYIAKSNVMEVYFKCVSIIKFIDFVRGALTLLYNLRVG